MSHERPAESAGQSNPSHTDRLIEEYARADISELREQLSGYIGFALLVIGGTIAWATLPGRTYRSEIATPAFWVAISGALIFALRKRAPILSQLVLLLGPSIATGLYVNRIAEPVVPYVSVVFVIACSSLQPALGIGSALLNTVPLLLSGLPDSVIYPAIGLLWLVALFSFIFSRGLYTALQWAWQSEEHAERLVRQLRDRQQEINRNNALLVEATRRLERTRNELAAARAYADEARGLKERFAANISHELRTPLNLILGFAELMHLTPDLYGDMVWPVELRRDVAQIFRSAQHLMDLINDVLELSRLDSMQMPVRREEASVAEIIYEACATMQQLIERQGLELNLMVPDDLPPLYVDAVRIRQIVLNLLSNAIRHTSQGSITVSASADDDAIVVSVIDTGSGIPADQLERIFVEYQSIDTSMVRRRGGAGLGLAISKRFVELHGGNIWVESIEGKGSAFHFNLPLVAADSSALVHLSARAPEAASARPVMLLVESDPAVEELLARHLQGIDLIRADDIAGARDLAARGSPRLVLVNTPPLKPDEPVSLPEALGSFGAVPTVITSLPSNSWMTGAMSIHAALSKPVSRKALLDVISDTGGGHVLVVDDDRGFARLMARYLENVPDVASVRTAYDGAQALSLCLASPPDVLLLDLIMPGVDGFAVLDELKARPELAQMRIVIITATDYAHQLLASRRVVLWLGGATSLSVQQVLRYLQVLIDATPPVDEGAAPGPASAADQPA
mgnify:FL=1